MSKILSVIVVAILIAAAGSFAYLSFSNTEEVSAQGTKTKQPKAAIIDQLSSEIPNPEFKRVATNFLELAGYTVDYYPTEKVTVDFYKKLPKMDYDYVVVRSHGTSDKVDGDVVLFTGETYTEDRYITEQLFGTVKRATPFLIVGFTPELKSEWVIVNDTYKYKKTTAVREDTAKDEFFGVSPKMFEGNGKFDGTVFLLGGCSTVANPSMAKALINQGASLVVGWDDAVSSGDNDKALLTLLKENLIEKRDLDDVVDNIEEYRYLFAQEYNGTMQYYTTDDI